MEIPMGRGVLEAKILKQSMKLKWNFLGGRGCKTKNPSVERTWIFLELHNIKNIISHLVKTLDMVLQEILHFSVKLFS